MLLQTTQLSNATKFKPANQMKYIHTQNVPIQIEKMERKQKKKSKSYFYTLNIGLVQSICSQQITNETQNIPKEIYDAHFICAHLSRQLMADIFSLLHTFDGFSLLHYIFILYSFLYWFTCAIAFFPILSLFFSNLLILPFEIEDEDRVIVLLQLSISTLPYFIFVL